MKYLLFIGMFSFLLVSCVKDRQQLIDNAAINGPYRNFILINEYMAKETKMPSLNELGVPSDWVELYNPGADTLNLKKGKWFITDDFAVKGKFPLPKTTLSPGQHLIIWCDKNDTVSGLSDIHVNFNLSAGGEEIGLFYLNPNGNDTLAYDTRTFNTQEADVSEGRISDGAADWTTFITPSPGKENKE